jgi:zinc protease
MKPAILFSIQLIFACVGLGVSAAGLSEEIEISYKKVVLANGLTVIVHEDHKAPIIAVNIWYHVGSKNEIPGRTGFAHLFEHLMFQGSENYDDEYLLFLQQLGAVDLNATTWFDRTNYFETVPKNTLDTVLWLESDRMGHFAGVITQEKLDEQRGVVQNEKRQGDNQPYGKVWEHLLRQVFPPGHPYSWDTIGSMEDLEAATVDDVKDWFATYYGPDNAVLVIAGDVDTDIAIAKVEKYFGDIPPGPPLAKPRIWIPDPVSERRQTMQDRVPQARLYKAWPGPRWGTTEATHFALAASILGHNKNSRLYQRLVHKDQLATDVSLSLQPFEISGLIYLVGSAHSGVELAEIELAANEVIAKFVRNGPNKKELERVKMQARAAFLRGIEQVGGFGGKAGVLARNMVYGGSPDLYKRWLADIDSTTSDDLRKVVEKWLGTGPFVMEVHPFPELAASNDGADRSEPPIPSGYPQIGFPRFERTHLSNGLEVIVSPRSGSPVVEMTLIMDAGYASDQFSRPGTASLGMAMLDEGTENRSALEITDALALQGATLRASSNLDNSYITLSALKTRLEESMEIFADVTLNPSFPEDELDRLKRRSLESIRQEKTRPMSMALRVLPSLLYGKKHPYGQPLTGSGTETSVSDMTRADMIEFHDAWLKPNHSTLVIVGDVTTSDLIPRLEELFGAWQSGEIPEKNLAVAIPSQSNVLYLVDRPDSDQSIVFAGQLLPRKSNPDEVAIQAMNDILGGMSSSRINMNLREDKHWSYGAYSSIVEARGLRPLLAYAPVQTDKTAESIMELSREFTGIAGNAPPEESELTIVKLSDTLSLPGRWETAADVMGSINEIVRFNLPDDYWDNYAARVNGLNLDDVTRAATSFIAPDQILWVVVGDAARIEARLRELEFDEIRRITVDGDPVTSE